MSGRAASQTRVLGVAVGVVAAVLALAALPSRGGSGGAGPEAIAGHWIILLEEGVSPEIAARDLAIRHGLGVKAVYRHALSGFAATVPQAALAAIEADDRVTGIYPDHEITPFDAATGVDRIDAEAVPSVGDCESPAFRVAILDTGIDFDHPELNVDAGNSATFAGGGPDADDKNGHGTHVAGGVAAKIGVATVNGADVRGSAPGTCLIAVKVLANNGRGSDSGLIAGLDYVTANASTLDIRVANLSLGRPAGNDGAVHAAIQNAAKAGVVIVVAAGNATVDSSGVVPASYDEVITVSAIKDLDGAGGATGGDGDDTFASFSNFGADVDVAAPGHRILSTWVNGGYAIASGTSFSAPLVSGAVSERIAAGALVLAPSADPLAARNAAMSVLNTRPQSHIGCGFSGDPDAHPEPIVYVGRPDTDCGASNEPPNVDAGADQEVTLPNHATLTGIVSDDGLPSPPSAVTVEWTQEDGPGEVTFGDETSAETTATFSTDGTYLLRITARDGELEAFDELTVVVNPAPFCRGHQATIVGTPGADELEGTPGPDVIVGMDGDDTIEGLGGDDVICGDEGNDLIIGGDGHDELYGGSGDDVLRGGPGRDTLVGSTGSDTILGGGWADLIFGGADGDILKGQAGDDEVFGGAGSDDVRGGAGNDSLYGDGRADVLRGGLGDDHLDGGNGADELLGGSGVDVCDGGLGTDVNLGGCETIIDIP